MGESKYLPIGYRVERMTIYKKQVAAYVAELELEPDDARRVYRHIVDNWLNPGDAETVAGEMGLI